MARTPNPATELMQDTPLAVDSILEQQNSAAVVTAMADERDLMNQLLGQAQMADAFAQFSVTVTTSKLAFVKENKLYRALAGKKSGDGHQFSGTWEEFCSVIGRSREQIDEDIRNLKVLGEEALESMSRMGIGYRELRQYRRLPEDQKTALLEVAKAGDKDAFLELAEEMIAKHAKEKESLAKQIADKDADLEASRRRVAEQTETIQQKESALIKLTAGTLPWDERTAEFRKGIVDRRTPMVESLHDSIEAIKKLDEWLTEHITSQPGYDPEAPVSLPKEINSVLIQLDESIETAAHLAAQARHELTLRFGADLDLAKQYLLVPQGE